MVNHSLILVYFFLIGDRKHLSFIFSGEEGFLKFNGEHDRC